MVIASSPIYSLPTMLSPQNFQQGVVRAFFLHLEGVKYHTCDILLERMNTNPELVDRLVNKNSLLDIFPHWTMLYIFSIVGFTFKTTGRVPVSHSRKRYAVTRIGQVFVIIKFGIRNPDRQTIALALPIVTRA
jgi:hypothetical protein